MPRAITCMRRRCSRASPKPPAVSLERMRDSVRPEELSRAIEMLARRGHDLPARRAARLSGLGLLRLRVRQARGARHADRPRRPIGPGAARAPPRSATRCSPSASHPMRRSRRNSPRRPRGATFRWWRSPISTFSPLVDERGCVARSGGGGFRRLPLAFGILRAGDGARGGNGGETRGALTPRVEGQTRTGFPLCADSVAASARRCAIRPSRPVGSQALAGLHGVEERWRVRPDRPPHSARGRSPAPDRRSTPEALATSTVVRWMLPARIMPFEPCTSTRWS